MPHIPWHFWPTFDHILNIPFPTFMNILVTFNNIPAPPLTLNVTFDDIGRTFFHIPRHFGPTFDHISDIQFPTFMNILITFGHIPLPPATINLTFENIGRTYGSHSKTFSASTWSHFRHLISKIYQHNTCNFNIDSYHITYFFNTLRKEQTIHHNLWHYLTGSDTA